MKIKGLFVSAIGTDSGKTVVSSILCKAMDANYWKPIQSGLPRDTETVASLAQLSTDRTLPEKYLLNTPVSPHQSADIDGVKININEISLPHSNRFLVVEGAGGLMVPINHEPQFVADLILGLNLPLVLVSNLYLGSINHTLLSLHYLKAQNIKLLGIVFNGADNIWSRKTIESYAQAPVIGHVPHGDNPNPEWILKMSELLKPGLLSAIQEFEDKNAK